METRANYALIGAVLLFAFAGLMGVVLWMAQVQYNREFEVYDVIFEGPVNGLSEGAAVRYLGLKVGEVDDLRIDPQDDARVIARIEVDSQTPVRTDSKAILDFVGLTGATFIQIQAGSPDAPLVRRRMGEPVPVIRTEPTQLESLVSGGQAIMSDASETLKQLNEVLSKENVASLSSTLKNLDTLTSELAGEDGLVTDVRATLQKIDEAVESLDRAATAIETLAQSSEGDLGRLADTLDTAIQAVQADVSDLQDSLASASENFSQTLDNLEEPAVMVMADVRRVGQDMQILVQRLDRLARELETNPRGFVLGEPLPERQ